MCGLRLTFHCFDTTYMNGTSVVQLYYGMPYYLGASTRYLWLNGSCRAGLRAGGGVSAGWDCEITD